MRINRRQWLIVSLSLPCAVGAAEPLPAADWQDPGFARPTVGALVLSLHLPANEAAYRTGDDEARQLVESSLVRAGYRVARIDPADYYAGLRQRLRDPALSGAPTQGPVFASAEAEVLSVVARVACEASASPLLLRTRLKTRVVEIRRSVARWDGVSRDLLVDPQARWNAHGDGFGKGPGISIEAVALKADGRLAILRHGGVALPFMRRPRGLDLPEETVALDKPFTDPEWMREGVAIALAPLLPR